MTCTSCGDKPKNSSKGFPRAVVEINNPESLVLLRKVVIPVSMGTEEDVPPTIGKYFNVILQYEANGHIYLYSSDGIPTAIEANIPQEVLDRIEDLEIDVDLLETGLANEAEAREAADSALSSSINSLSSSLSAETAAREQADTTLQNNITAEATARENGDAALNTAITSETTARQEADTNLQNQITQEAQARAAADTAINGAITAEATARQTADAGLQSQIDAITAGSDVKDIVGTKAELNNYDTSTLGDNDIVKVLQDESENNATTYYRWNATTQQFTLIGEEGPYYTKSQADTLLNAKQNTLTAGSNVQIVNDTISATDTTYTAGTGLALNGTQFSVDTTAIATQSDLTAGLANKQDTLTAGTNIQINNNTISATDTTYSDFTGTDGTTAGAAGLVPAPATTDAGKVLGANGSWVTGGPTVVQTTGTSTTDVMSQNAVTSMVYNDPATKKNVVIGGGSTYGATDPVAIGRLASVRGNYAVAIGSTAGSQVTNAPGGISLGAFSKAAGQGQMDISLVTATQQTQATCGYNGSAYRLLTGLYDGQSDHDAATYGQVISYSAVNGAGAPTTATEGKYVGQLYYDTTNEAMYFLKTIDTTTTPATYTWEALGGGGGLDPNTTFWGRTANNGVVDGGITISSADGLPGMYIGYGQIEIDKPAAFYLRARKNSSTYSNVLWWNSASNDVPSDVHLDAAGTKMTLLTNEVRLGGRYSSDNVKISNVDTPQSAHDAATKGYCDARIINGGSTPPTTSTVGAVGTLYSTVESDTGHLYICTSDAGGTYTWQTLI